MGSETFVQFCAFLLFSLFNVYWEPRFAYRHARWVVILLQIAGVVGAGLVLVGIL